MSPLVTPFSQEGERGRGRAEARGAGARSGVEGRKGHEVAWRRRPWRAQKPRVTGQRGINTRPRAVRLPYSAPCREPCPAQLPGRGHGPSLRVLTECPWTLRPQRSPWLPLTDEAKAARTRPSPRKKSGPPRRRRGQLPPRLADCERLSPGSSLLPLPAREDRWGDKSARQTPEEEK